MRRQIDLKDSKAYGTAVLQFFIIPTIFFSTSSTMKMIISTEIYITNIHYGKIFQFTIDWCRRPSNNFNVISKLVDKLISDFVTDFIIASDLPNSFSIIDTTEDQIDWVILKKRIFVIGKNANEHVIALISNFALLSGGVS